MSNPGLAADPTTGNSVQSFIDFLQQRKKKKPELDSPTQIPGAAPNASMFGGNMLMSPAMQSILGR